MSDTNKSSDKIYQIWLQQITQTERDLPQITQAAEVWANKVVKDGGEVYATGDIGFWRENVYRAGGIGFVHKLTPDVVLDKNDVVLVGFEYADETNHRAIIEPILKTGATVLLFAESGADKEFKNLQKSPEQLILIPCDKGLDGLVSFDSTKYVSLTGMTHILHLWVTTAEFFGACTRLGRMPNTLVSITHPQGWSLNADAVVSRFFQDNTPAPVEKGTLGKRYLEKVKEISKLIAEGDSAKNISKAAQWIAETVKGNHQIEETLTGHWAVYLFSNHYTPKFFTTKHKLEKGDLQIRLEYNFYPNSEIEPLLNKGVRIVFMSTSEKDNDKFKGVIMSNNGQLLTPWNEIPQRDDLLLIDGHWPQYDSTLTLPDYPYPFCPSSWVAHGLVHWLLTAETMERLSEK